MPEVDLFFAIIFWPLIIGVIAFIYFAFHPDRKEMFKLAVIYRMITGLVGYVFGWMNV